MRVRLPPTVLVACVAYHAVAAQSSSSAELMQRVAAYVERYGDEASVIIAVERYRQEVTQQVTSGITTETAVPGRPSLSTTAATQRAVKSVRKLTSEMALVRNAAAVGGWLGFRDVMEVDGTPTGEHDRLRDVFAANTPEIDKARRIGEENARYNAGPVTRTFNVPTSALFFFHSANLPRFTFQTAGHERVDGVDTIKIAFQETAAPSLIMTRAGRDVPARGVLWVRPQDGSVLRTQLIVSGYRGDASVATIDVAYRLEPTLNMLVPSSMREYYSVPQARVSAEATYSDFKRFQTSVRVK